MKAKVPKVLWLVLRKGFKPKIGHQVYVTKGGFGARTGLEIDMVYIGEAILGPKGIAPREMALVSGDNYKVITKENS